MAEWLCSGLQIRVRRFDSGLRLQNFTFYPPLYVSAIARCLLHLKSKRGHCHGVRLRVTLNDCQYS